MHLDDGVVVLHAAPLGFDASTLATWGPLLNGGCCVLDDETVPTGTALTSTIGTHGVQAAWLTSALFNAVVDDDPRQLAGLRELLIGGEALSLDRVHRFLAAVPQTQLINGYGPTETTTFAATHRIDAASLAGARSVPIGHPITVTSLYVLNQCGEPVPDGFVGELRIGGLGVGRGYLGRPEPTAERFLTDPFAGGGGTMYRTGDLLRRLTDDALEFIGRADGQVKIRGFRIEVGEVEAGLAAHESFQACTVVARNAVYRGAELVAYVVTAGSNFSPATLREYLATRLPDFMVPALWVRLPLLPVTSNGKLDRRALPEPGRERPDHLVQPDLEPRSGLEREIAEAFARTLGMARVGALDNFFDLGGSSLLVMKVFSAPLGASHNQLSVATMFAEPTAHGLARALGTPQAPAAQTQRVSNLAGPSQPAVIVGMAGRVPGAPDIESLWQMLDDGREGIRFFHRDEFGASVPKAWRADPQYVAARGVLDGVDLFDSGFFGITANEAELVDPKHQVFPELYRERLERAGKVPEKTASPIGIFACMYNATYYQRHVLAHADKVARDSEFQVLI